MRFAGSRARQYFDNARLLLAEEDRRSLVAAEIMGAIYSGLLDRIEASHYRVFDRTFRLPTAHKLWIALSIWMSSIGTAVRR
jgi:phytoene/squalene synthetase